LLLGIVSSFLRLLPPVSASPRNRGKSMRIDPAHYAGLPRHIPRPHHRPLGIQQVPEVERRPLAVYDQLAGVRDDG
jgi:hypothetical protein